MGVIGVNQQNSIIQLFDRNLNYIKSKQMLIHTQENHMNTLLLELISECRTLGPSPIVRIVNNHLPALFLKELPDMILAPGGDTRAELLRRFGLLAFFAEKEKGPKLAFQLEIHV